MVGMRAARLHPLGQAGKHQSIASRLRCRSINSIGRRRKTHESQPGLRRALTLQATIADRNQLRWSQKIWSLFKAMPHHTGIWVMWRAVKPGYRMFAFSDSGRYQFAFSLSCCYQFAVSPSCNKVVESAWFSAEELTVFRVRDDGAWQSEAPPSTTDRVEYVVRPSDDAWMIEHDGGRYGPYKNSREAMFFAVDAARKLGALGKNTHVKMTDHAGHPLTTWNYGSDRYSAMFWWRTRRVIYVGWVERSETHPGMGQIHGAAAMLM
jgi:hypothetical protein